MHMITNILLGTILFMECMAFIQRTNIDMSLDDMVFKTKTDISAIRRHVFQILLDMPTKKQYGKQR